jgi:hypothetical protein
MENQAKGGKPVENRIAIFSKLVRDFMRDVPLAVPIKDVS